MCRYLICVLISMVAMAVNVGQLSAGSNSASAAVAARSSDESVSDLRQAVKINLKGGGPKHAFSASGRSMSRRFIDECDVALYKKAIRFIPSEWFVLLKLSMKPGHKKWSHARLEDFKSAIDENPKAKEVWGLGKHLENMIQVVQFAQKATTVRKGPKSVQEVQAMLCWMLDMYHLLRENLEQYHCQCKKCDRKFVCIEGNYDDRDRVIICRACDTKKSGMLS